MIEAVPIVATAVIGSVAPVPKPNRKVHEQAEPRKVYNLRRTRKKLCFEGVKSEGGEDSNGESESSEEDANEEDCDRVPEASPKGVERAGLEGELEISEEEDSNKEGGCDSMPEACPTPAKGVERAGLKGDPPTESWWQQAKDVDAACWRKDDSGQWHFEVKFDCRVNDFCVTLYEEDSEQKQKFLWVGQITSINLEGKTITCHPYLSAQNPREASCMQGIWRRQTGKAEAMQCQEVVEHKAVLMYFQKLTQASRKSKSQWNGRLPRKVQKRAALFLH